LATPEQILETNQLFNLAWPGKSPDDRFLPDGHIAAFIDAGRTPAEISAAFSHGMSVLGFTVDPPCRPRPSRFCARLPMAQRTEAAHLRHGRCSCASVIWPAARCVILDCPPGRRAEGEDLRR
jgi:hypothetical protein